VASLYVLVLVALTAAAHRAEIKRLAALGSKIALHELDERLDRMADESDALRGQIRRWLRPLR
jgi:hypothetical protein